MRTQVKDLLNYSPLDQVIPEASSCKYLGIILRSDLCWTDHFKLHSKKCLEGISFHSACS